MFNFMDKNKGKAKLRTFQIRNIPDSLWVKFKVICTQKDISLDEELISLIERYTKGKAIG